MIVPDVNLLLYAFNDGSPRYDSAKRWWEDLVNGAERVGIPWIVSVGFVRLMTHPKMLARPVTPEEAVDYVHAWFRFSHITPISPGPDHLTHLRRNLAAAASAGTWSPMRTSPPWRWSTRRRFTRTTQTSAASPAYAGATLSDCLAVVY
jgi:toxin-antitoxin system PIN domain toxin